MNESIEKRLEEVELRLSAIETRAERAASEPDVSKKEIESRREFVGGLPWIVVPVSVFAWLSHSEVAWGAVGVVGIVAVAGTVALARRVL